LEILEPVSQAAEDFENEVLHGISRELDLDDIGILISFFCYSLFI